MKITAVNGNLSDLIAVLQTVLEDYGDRPVFVCGVQPVQIYNKKDGILLDDDANLEEVDYDGRDN